MLNIPRHHPLRYNRLSALRQQRHVIFTHLNRFQLFFYNAECVIALCSWGIRPGAFSRRFPSLSASDYLVLHNESRPAKQNHATMIKKKEEKTTKRKGCHFCSGPHLTVSSRWFLTLSTGTQRGWVPAVRCVQLRHSAHTRLQPALSKSDHLSLLAAADPQVQEELAKFVQHYRRGCLIASIIHSRQQVVFSQSNRTRPVREPCRRKQRRQRSSSSSSEDDQVSPPPPPPFPCLPPLQ